MQRRHLLLGGSASLLAATLPGCGGGGSDATAAATGADTLSSAADARRGTPSDAGATGTASGTTTTTATAATKARVIVVGGGMAGATVAKYLRLWSGNTIDVTLVDRNARYTSNIMSSMVLTGQRTLASLGYGYGTLASRYGVKFVADEVLAIDPVNTTVTLRAGGVLKADRIVLAPGIAFDDVPGLSDPTRMPHAWQAGAQTTLLAQQLAAMPAGGTVALTIPATPYRCPPGPYERACLLADWLRQRKPGSKLLVLDANADIVTERDNFSRAFLGLHGQVIEYRPNAVIDHVDPAAMTLYLTDGSRVAASVVNLIPRQRAGALVAATGLATATGGRFAPVDVLSYACTVPGAQNVHVIGDASATTQPKAGHIANQEAKVCAYAIVRLVSGGLPDPEPVTNSACFSTITMSQASWLTAGFQYDPVARAMAPVAAAGGASNGWSSDSFEDMGTWFKSLMSDTFA
jgi:NADH dehydrogenase FAD-containing subunit